MTVSESGVYWKEGIYRATAPETMAADYRSLSLTTGTPTTLSSRTGSIAQSYTQYDSASHATTSTTVYTDGTRTINRYNSSGELVQSRVRHADGSLMIHDYLVTGHSYVADQRHYNAVGKLTEFVAIHADGSKAIDNYLIGGKAYSSDHLNFSASGVLTSAIYHNTNGSTTTDTYRSSGALMQVNVRHADGSRDIHDYGVTGQNYVTDHRIYNAAGTLTDFVGIGADGSKVVDDYAVSGKPYRSDQLTYNAGSVLTNAIYHENDGSTIINNYTSSGALAKHTIMHPGGSRDVYDYGIKGSSYISDHRAYTAAGKLTEFATVAGNGSVKAIAYAGGLKLVGGGANDAFYSHGGDSFVFKGTFGNDAVHYFHAGDLTNHDVMYFSPGAVPDFSHLHMAQAGSNVVITIDAHDTVTLADVKVAALTSHDFMFW